MGWRSVTAVGCCPQAVNKKKASSKIRGICILCHSPLAARHLLLANLQTRKLAPTLLPRADAFRESGFWRLDRSYSAQQAL
jgi:hypothetical protein